MRRAIKNILVPTLFALIALSEIAQAQTLGRLFSTPQERRELDAKRGAKPVTQPLIRPLPPVKQNPVIAAPASTYAPPPPQPTVINGFVRRSDGPNTVWLNEKPISGNAARDEWLQPSAVNSPVRVQSSTR
jgi:hypothetical protein